MKKLFKFREKITKLSKFREKITKLSLLSCWILKHHASYCNIIIKEIQMFPILLQRCRSRCFLYYYRDASINVSLYGQSLSTIIKPKKKKSSKNIFFQEDYRLDLLKNYKQLYGNLYVPKLFKIPSNPSWNSDHWDYKLGLYVQLLRRTYKNMSMKPKQLEDIGFIWDYDTSRYLQIRLGLLTYYKIYGDMLVPHKFVVPRTQQWDIDIHGLKLGSKVNHIRFQNQFKAYKRDLDSIGFVWNSDTYLYNKTIRALKKYKEIEGHMYISKTFVVPEDNNLWPDDLKGFDLGTIIGNIRYENRYKDRKAELDEIGFIWRMNRIDKSKLNHDS